MDRDTLCHGCKKRTDADYMLNDDLWESIAKPKEKYLCLACVEKRLGRKLEKADFQPLPINYIFGHLPLEEASEEHKDIILWALKQLDEE